MSETTYNLIQAMANGDALETEQAFGAAMAEKLAVKLDDMRTGIAQNMFNTPEQVAEELSEDQDLQMVVENATDDFEQDEISLSEEEVSELVEKYMGFEKTTAALAAKGAKNPKALAAWIGRKKYGKEKFQAAAASGKKMD
jgi:hypothetical protein